MRFSIQRDRLVLIFVLLGILSILIFALVFILMGPGEAPGEAKNIDYQRARLSWSQFHSRVYYEVPPKTGLASDNIWQTTFDGALQDAGKSSSLKNCLIQGRIAKVAAETHRSKPNQEAKVFCHPYQGSKVMQKAFLILDNPEKFVESPCCSNAGDNLSCKLQKELPICSISSLKSSQALVEKQASEVNLSKVVEKKKKLLASSLRIKAERWSDEWTGPNGLVLNDIKDLGKLSDIDKKTANMLWAKYQAHGVVSMADFTYGQKSSPESQITVRLYIFNSSENASNWVDLKYRGANAQNLYRTIKGLEFQTFESKESPKRVVSVENFVLSSHNKIAAPKDDAEETLHLLLLDKYIQKIKIKGLKKTNLSI